MDMIGLYPTWFVVLGSGWIVGLIATIHVLFSHTSVGAAIFSRGWPTTRIATTNPSYWSSYGATACFCWCLATCWAPSPDRASVSYHRG